MLSENYTDFWRKSSHKLQDALIDIGVKAIETSNKAMLNLVEKALEESSHDYKKHFREMTRQKGLKKKLKKEK